MQSTATYTFTPDVYPLYLRLDDPRKLDLFPNMHTPPLERHAQSPHVGTAEVLACECEFYEICLDFFRVDLRRCQRI